MQANKGSFRQCFRPSLSYQTKIFVLSILSGRFTHALLYYNHPAEEESLVGVCVHCLFLDVPWIVTFPGYPHLF